MNDNKPIREFRSGRVTASIWENEIERDGKPRSFLVTTLSKVYTDKEGQWKTSNRFTRRELEDAAHVIQDALDYVTLRETGDWRKKDERS